MTSISLCCGRRIKTAAAMLASLLGCDSTDLVAPAGSTLTIVATPATIATGGDSAQVGVIVLDSGGEPVEDGTAVILVTTLGALCEKGSVECTDTLASVIRASTTHGVVRAVLLSGIGAGTATITGRSGMVSATTNVTVSGLVAPMGSSMTIQSSPDTIAVGVGTATIEVFLATNNVPVPDRTRVVFTVTKGHITPSIGLTQDGFAQGTLGVLPDTGVVFVKVSSGVVVDSIPVVIK